MLRFQKYYFLAAVVIFIIEVLIALYVRDSIIRPYGGDTLVVILIYCFVKSFLDIPVLQLATYVLLFAFMIEFLQYFKLVELLGLGHSKLANIVIGNSFAWHDINAYNLGFILILIGEKCVERFIKSRAT